MIASKEKELKLSSEDLVGQYQGNPSKKYKLFRLFNIREKQGIAKYKHIFSFLR